MRWYLQLRNALIVAGVFLGLTLLARPQVRNAAATTASLESGIEVDAGRVTGNTPRYLFGQFMEHEHNTIDNGLLAQLLQDRKFEEGDVDGNGVANRWVPEERVDDRYWQLHEGRGVNDRYYIDHQIYYGGASQAIQLYGPGPNHASIYQIGLQLAKGRQYSFYVYLRMRGTGSPFMTIGSLGGPVYFRKDFDNVNSQWRKYTAEFTATADTKTARVRIGFQGEGTLWIDSASLMPADNIDGMRRDVIEALRPMRISVLRYPGGCYADYYHWKDGVGPRDKRREKWSTAWHEWNSNDFGADEYAELARLLGFQGQITANYISGTPQEAAQWVQYANGPANTPMGKLRARNGHPKPYGFKLWAIGNEAPGMCSSQYTGGVKLSDYVRRYHEYEAAMKKADPSIRVMASSVGRPRWARRLLKAMPVDLLATSIYTGPHGKMKQICDPDTFYQKVVAEPLEFKDQLDANIHAAGNLLPRHPFFAITEFNSWWLPETEDPDYRLANALYFAGVFNTLLRHSQYIFLAEPCSLINVQGMIEVNPVAIKLTPPYFAYVLYANHTGTKVLKTVANSPATMFDSQLPTLDAVATLSANQRTVDLAVVNRSQDRAVTAQIQIKDWRPSAAPAQADEVNGKSWNASNPYGSTANVDLRQSAFEIPGAAFSYRFPAHSVTILEIHGNLKATQ